MKTFAIYCALALASLAIGSGARTTIRRVHREYEIGMRKNDYASVKRVVQANFAKGFSASRWGGSKSRSEYIADIPSPGFVVRSFRFEPRRFKINGNVARVRATMRSILHSTWKGQTPIVMHISQVYYETWKKLGSQWEMLKLDNAAVVPRR